MLSRFIPSSLFVRFILIIILPTIFAQVIATYVFYHRHWGVVSRNMAKTLSNDIKIIVDLNQSKIAPAALKNILDELGIKLIVSNLNNQQVFEDVYNADTEDLFNLLKEKFNCSAKISFIDENLAVRIDLLLDRKIYSFITNSKRIINPSTYIFILWMTGTSLLFLLLSIVFTRNQIRPIIKLARAADKFGKGQTSFLIKPEGAKEIRNASIAFIKMKERIERQITYRTEMLAGVSHDLRTPLTRMKLQIALSKDPDIGNMIEDIKDMEIMINAFIDFARGDSKEKTQIIFLNKFLNEVINPYKQQKLDCSLKNIPSVKLALKFNALKRCLQNLLDNAFKYGTSVIINSSIIQEEVFIEIHDNGPGISIENREEVFRPFYRLDQARNSESGSVGLGLAIARDIITNHGGQISLSDSELLLGLKVTIILPLL